MSSTFLIIGATGNTGQAVVQTLSNSTQDGSNWSAWNVLALTRSADGSAAQVLARLPSVQVVQQAWTDIDKTWLVEHQVKRVFFAGPVGPTAFTDESGLLLALRDAGVELLVRISTSPANVGPASTIPHARMHWAIEILLDHPDYASLHTISIQPNIYFGLALGPALKWVKDVRETGKQTPFGTSFAEDAGVAMIDPADVGKAAAHLLLGDTSKHNCTRLQINGPEEITGRDVVKLIEGTSGIKIEQAKYKDLSFLDQLIKDGYPKRVVEAVKAGFDPLWNGDCGSQKYPTSQPIEELAPPATKVETWLRSALD